MGQVRATSVYFVHNVELNECLSLRVHDFNLEAGVVVGACAVFVKDN